MENYIKDAEISIKLTNITNNLLINSNITIILYKIHKEKVKELYYNNILYNKINKEYFNKYILQIKNFKNKYLFKIIVDNALENIKYIKEIEFFLDDILKIENNLLKFICKENILDGITIQIKLNNLNEYKNNNIKFQISVKKIKKTYIFKTNITYCFKILKFFEKKKFTEIYKSEWLLVNKDNFILFKPININANNFNNNNDNIENKLELYKIKNGKESFIGYTIFKIKDLLDNTNKILNIESKSKSNYKFVINNTLKTKNVNILNYISSGLNFNINMVIDFSASNKNEENEVINNHIKTEDNIYLKSINKIYNILNKFIKLKENIYWYGFGAKLNFQNIKSKKCSHFFSLNNNELINNLEEISKVYYNSWDFIKLSGPTYLSTLFKNINIKSNKNLKIKNSYEILIIFSDGEIHDLEDSIDFIVESTYLPISIIIIVINAKEFNNLYILNETEIVL